MVRQVPLMRHDGWVVKKPGLRGRYLHSTLRRTKKGAIAAWMRAVDTLLLLPKFDSFDGLERAGYTVVKVKLVEL